MENKTGKYFKYAIGEIVLVVIGILIALQINNWNEGRKTIEIEKQSFENLLTSLKKDSLELVSIVNYQVKSLDQINKIVTSSASEITRTMSKEEISMILYDLQLGGLSFFPKYGVYNSIISSRGIDIIKSEIIKSNLIDLYDYEYKRYESIDKVLDERFQNIIGPFLQREVKFYINSSSEYNIIDKKQFEKVYSELQLQCQHLTGQLNASSGLLKSIQENVNVLILEMEKEKVN